MAQNYLQSGHSMTLTPSVAVSAGDGCMFGNGLFGIALNDCPAGKAGAFGTVGVWQLPKQTGVAIADGASVIYDFTNKRVATTGTGPRIGVAQAASAAAPYVSVRLDHHPNGVTYETNPLTGGNEFLIDGVRFGFGATPPRSQMQTVCIGNSISNQSKFSGTYWYTNGELMLANNLAGAPMRFKRMTATTRMDLFGVYGYSGQTLPTILADLEGQVYSQLRTAGMVPDLVVGLALLENDIAGGATYTAMAASLTQFIRDVQARYPGAVLLLCTPRPSFSYDTAAKVAAYQAVRDLMLSLDNGHNIFVARCDGYENPASPGTPLGTSGTPIYTDASVHPNAKGGLLNARPISATLKRISAVWKPPYQSNSTNMALGGTGAAGGTNVSGTVPTGVTVTGSANATSFVCTAEQPGLLMAVTVPATAGPDPADISTFNFGALAVAGTEISPFVEIELVSGAENLHGIELFARDGATATWFYHLQNQASNAQPDYQNGDVLTLRIPPILVSAITSGTCNIYCRPRMKYQGGTATFRARSQGIGLVS